MSDIISTTTDRKEVGLGDVLARVLSEDVFHDLKLKGSDGVVVGASRVILAARSQVFQGMLLGKFNEGTSDTIEINEYNGSVLKAVVEYVHTDKPQILNFKKRKADKDSIICSPEEIETLLSLTAASMFFDLPGLLEQTMEFLSKVLEKSPFLSFFLLEVCKKQGPAVPDELTEKAWSGVRSRSSVDDAGNAEADACLSQELMEEILKDKATELNEYQLFQLLTKWTEANTLDRKPVAQELIKHIRLQGISPEHLSSTVKPSDLVTTEQLLEVYEVHFKQLAAASGECLSIEQGRLPVWSNTSSSVCTRTSTSTEQDYESGFLQCHPISSGVHQWSLERVGENWPLSLTIGFGVALKGTTADDNGMVIGQEGSSGFFNDGHVYCGAKCTESSAEGRRLEDGDRVTLTLNLCPGAADNGTLTGSIQREGGETVPLGPIKDLRKHLVQNPNGFLPVVEAYESFGFRILGYQKLQD